MLIVLFLVSQFNFLFVPCGGLSWLPVSFLLHVKYTLSYRIVTWTFYIFHKIFYVILVHLLLVVFSKQRKSRHNGCKNTNKLHWVQWTQHWFSYVKSLIHLQLEIGSCLVKESWVCHISSYSATSGWKFRHFWTCVRGVLLKRWKLRTEYNVTVMRMYQRKKMSAVSWQATMMIWSRLSPLLRSRITNYKLIRLMIHDRY